MKWFLDTYTGRFIRPHKLFGHRFNWRYDLLWEMGWCDEAHLRWTPSADDFDAQLVVPIGASRTGSVTDSGC